MPARSRGKAGHARRQTAHVEAGCEARSNHEA
jgi:hypothetical protein